MDALAEGQNFSVQQAHAMLEKMYDTFLRYLELSTVHRYMQVENVSLEDVSDLLNWVLSEGEIEEQHERCRIFIHALKAANNEGTQNVLRGQTGGKVVDEYTELLIATLEGELFQRLSKSNVSDIADILTTKKGIITQGNNEKLKKMSESQSALEACIEMFSLMKRGKVDWPFLFLEAVVEVQPQIQSEVRGGSRVAEMSMGRFGLSHLGVNFSNHFPRSIHDRDEIRYGYTNKVHVTDEEHRNMQALVCVGAIAENQLSICADVSQDSVRSKDYAAGFSDGEEDKSESEDTEKDDSKRLKLREYQKELAETALTGRNTIICAPTGSGKTRVSTYIVLKHLQANEGKKVAFLARTVPLVLQQYKSMQEFLPRYKIGQVTGDDEQRKNVHFLLPNLDVVVMTPKILENHINIGVLKLEDFSLIIFDECHHTREEEPYNTLMVKYLQTKMKDPNAPLPQIVGLTASIGIENAVREEEAVDNILKICGNLDCDNISMVHRNKTELTEKVPVPVEEILNLIERERDGCVTAIEVLMKSLESEMEQFAADLKMEDMQKLATDIIRTQKKSQQYNQKIVKMKQLARSFPILDRDRETNMSVRSLIILTEYLKEYNFALDAYDLVQMHDVIEYLSKSFQRFRENERRTRGETRYYNWFEDLKTYLSKISIKDNSCLIRLAKTLKEHLIGKGVSSRGIVFVRTRALCYALTSWLKRCDDASLRSLNAQMFTGTGASAWQLGMTQADQEAVVQQFRNGETRLLVATTVAEEGLDVPDCNLVVKYNHVGNEVTTVQTRGRSRKVGGTSVLLAMGKVRDREIANQSKAKLMVIALEKIRKMSLAEIHERNARHQKRRMIDVERKELLKQQEKSSVRNVDFSMVCALCRKVMIHSRDIRTIEKVHRVVVDRSIWENVKVLPYSTPQYVDDVRMLGSARCKGQPEEGKFCFNHFGTVIIYKEVPFVVLGLKNFVVETQMGRRTESFTRWKKVPYKVDEMDLEDLRRYLNLSSIKEEDSGFQGAESSQVGDGSKEQSMHEEGEKEEKTGVQTLEKDHDNDETELKQVNLDVQAYQQQQTDSGLFSGNSRQTSNHSEGNTVPKELIASQKISLPQPLPSGSRGMINAVTKPNQQKVVTQLAQVSESTAILTHGNDDSYDNTEMIRESLQKRSQARVELIRIDQELRQAYHKIPPLNTQSIESSMGKSPSSRKSVLEQQPSAINNIESRPMSPINQDSFKLLISSSTDWSNASSRPSVPISQGEHFVEARQAEAVPLHNANPSFRHPQNVLRLEAVENASGHQSANVVRGPQDDIGPNPHYVEKRLC